ncbi:MAG TPA: MBL fold metallo-hydrolase [Gemmatimonadales bacterium]|jgi:phosphoribosyl 1,2-cyclic phosphodiesterase|nr:MBL fold metallo-hydrolase [Gemmatimonadales bacterium]
MSTLTVLGSGSKGNAMALAAEGAVLLIDAGFSARELARRAELAAVNLGTLCGIALTHEHGDHTQGAVRLAERHRVPLLTSAGTWSALGAPSGVTRIPIATTRRTECGPFTLSGCALLHDAAEPLALSITTTSGVRLGIAYDFGRATQALRYHFRAMNAVILEANYDELMLRTSDYPASVQHRIAGSAGHLSNRATAQLLQELLHPGLGTVVLAHLSQRCNSPEVARRTVEPVLRGCGFRGEFHVAVQDAPLPPIRLSRSLEVLELFPP